MRVILDDKSVFSAYGDLEYIPEMIECASKIEWKDIDVAFNEHNKQIYCDYSDTGGFIFKIEYVDIDDDTVYLSFVTTVGG